MRSCRALIPSALYLAAAATGQTVQTRKGTIQGGKCASTAVNYFFSIPFAKPPTGNLRYAPPQPLLDSYHGTLNATEPAPSCIQFSSAFTESGAQSEDCLYIDVWAPTSATQNSELPVKVWLYGGVNEAGGISDPTYDGCFSATDSIVVSINYRVGPLGFLALSDMGLCGNFGVQDQLLGLRWVQENIAAFGGNPRKVLLFGQSAGATDAYVVATLPQAPGLISAAALESGGGRSPPTVASAQSWQTTLADALNCSTSDLACMRAISTSALQVAVAAMPNQTIPSAYTPFDFQGSRSQWGPLVDGHIIPVSPESVPIKVPAIFGSNTNEGALFVLGAYGRTALNQTNYDQFLEFNFASLAPIVNATFSLDRFNNSANAAISTIITDVTYKCPAYRALLKAEGSGVPVWAYEFKHTPSCAWYSAIPSAFVPVLGPTHTAEIPFVFNTTYSLPLPAGNCTFNDKEVALAGAMSRAWTNMAEFGNVGDEALWPLWTANSSAGVNIVDSMIVGTVDYSVCDFWDKIDAESEKIVYG